MAASACSVLAAYAWLLCGAAFADITNPSVTPNSWPASDIAVATSSNVQVYNPAPGGYSHAIAFTVQPPAPTLTALDPAT